MADDDVIASYEQEFAREPQPRRTNRGFWLVAVALLLSGVVLVVEIFANRPIGESIGHAQASLRSAQAAAELVRQQSGSFAAADVDGLSGMATDLTFVAQDQPSAGLDQVSVLGSATGWAAAVQARPGACFYLRLEPDGTELYGVGTGCTALDAVQANDTRW
jgi:hypothetical protein